MVQLHLLKSVARHRGRGSGNTTRMTKVALLSTTKHNNKNIKNPKEMVEEIRRRMQQNHGDPVTAWESLWQDGITPWDLGGPTDALISEIKGRSSLRLPSMTLIPGCGSGYDLVSLGRYLDLESDERKEEASTIIGLELSKTSLQKAKSLLEKSLDSDGPFKRTTILLFEGNFFHAPSCWKPFFSTDDATNNFSDSRSPLPNLSSEQTFDLIFDYTFFCAIPPDQRRMWGSQMSRLLAPHGNLLTLMFPYHASSKRTVDAETRGPPYLVSLDTYKDALVGGDQERLEMDTPLPYASLATARQRQGQEVVGWWYKAKL